MANITVSTPTAVAGPLAGLTASWVLVTSPRLPGTSSQNAGRNTTSRGSRGLIASTR